MSLDAILDTYNSGEPPSERDLAEVIVMLRREIDRLEELSETLPEFDGRIIVRMDGSDKLLRFSSLDALARYIIPD